MLFELPDKIGPTHRSDMKSLKGIEQKLQRISAQEQQVNQERERLAVEVGEQIGAINQKIAELQHELGSLFEQRRKLEEFFDQQGLRPRTGGIRKTRQVILDYLGDHPNSSAPEISRDTGIAEPTVQAQLARAMDDDQVKRHGKRPFAYKLSASETNDPITSTRPKKITLHEEIRDILLESDNDWRSTKELAALVNERQRYHKKDGSEVTAYQIHGRTKNYSHLFEKDKQLVRLLSGTEEAGA